MFVFGVLFFCCVFFVCVFVFDWGCSYTYRLFSLLLLISCIQTGREEKATGQTDTGPGSGQTPKNEEETRIPGKVNLQIPRKFFQLSFAVFVFNLTCGSFWWAFLTKTLNIFPGWCLHVLCASSVRSTRKKWRLILRVASTRTTLSSFPASCPSPLQTFCR